MSVALRVMLVVGALATLLFFLYQIRKKRMQIEYTISWCLFSVLLLFISIFPEVVTWASRLLGFQSPANLVYLIVIFVLIIKLFTTTMRLSQMNRNITELAQAMALGEGGAEEKEDKRPL